MLNLRRQCIKKCLIFIIIYIFHWEINQIDMHTYIFMIIKISQYCQPSILTLSQQHYNTLYFIVYSIISHSCQLIIMKTLIIKWYRLGSRFGSNSRKLNQHWLKPTGICLMSPGPKLLQQLSNIISDLSSLSLFLSIYKVFNFILFIYCLRDFSNRLPND